MVTMPWVMYRCFHCRDLHVTADQARACASADDDWYDEALAELDRILDRGPIPWGHKRTMRDEASWTLPERQMMRALDEALPGEVRVQWWIPGCDYRVDLFIPSVSLAIEVDGASHEGRQGPDRLRSCTIRSNGVTILRIPNDRAMTEAPRLAALIAERVRAEAPAPSLQISA